MSRTALVNATDASDTRSKVEMAEISFGADRHGVVNRQRDHWSQGRAVTPLPRSCGRAGEERRLAGPGAHGPRHLTPQTEPGTGLWGILRESPLSRRPP